MGQVIRRDFRKNNVNPAADFEQRYLDECLDYLNARIRIDYKDKDRWAKLKNQITRLYGLMEIYEIGVDKTHMNKRDD